MAKKRKKPGCAGCAAQYPRAWCMFNKRWEHCNTGIYFGCSAPGRNIPPKELQYGKEAKAPPQT